MSESLANADHLYEVERRDRHAERDGFRISEIQLGPTQNVPWHTHTHISDTFYVLAGTITIYLRDPKEAITLQPGESYAVAVQRPHLVQNPGAESATFLIMQGIGEYDFVPLT